MKRSKRPLIVVVCSLICALGIAHWLHARPIYAQQSSDSYDDGTFFIYSEIIVDNNYNLDTDSYMEVEYDDYEDIDEIAVEAYADQDNQIVYDAYQYGDDYDPAEVQLYSLKPVVPGHEYGIESDGYACYDDGEGDCYFYFVGLAYASVNVVAPLPQITSISPTSANQSSQGTLTVIGTNLVVGSNDSLTLNFSGGGSFTLAGSPSANTASFTYNLASATAGTYTISVTNKQGQSNSQNFAVNSTAPPQVPPSDPCAVSSDPKVGSTTIVSTASIGGNGTMSVSFGNVAFAKVQPTVSYGPYSTPSSIASDLAALISRKYIQYGIYAKAFGPSVVYGGVTNLGAVTNSFTGVSFNSDGSSTAASAASLACSAIGHIPCLGLHPDYDTARLYKQAGITETPRQHITRKHIVGPATLVPKNSIYVGNGGSQPAFTLIQGYNLTSVLLNPFGTPTATGIVFRHTFVKTTQLGPSGYYDSGWIGADASGNHLYTNNFYLSPDKCTVNTSFPTQ